MKNGLKIIAAWIIAAFAAGTVPALGAAEKPLLAQHPSLSRTQIVFAYAGDLWIAPRDGGRGHAPDDRASGSRAIPASRPTARWSPSRASTTGTSTSSSCRPRAACPAGSPIIPGRRRGRRLDARREAHHLPVGAGQRLGHPDALHGRRRTAASPRSCRCRPASRLLLGRRQRAWPTCRPCKWQSGLEALPRRPDDADLDRRSLADLKVEKVPRDNSNDSNPMWVGDKIYFLSDRKRAGVALRL